MTFTEAAAAMRRVADAIDHVVKSAGRDGTAGPNPEFDGEMAVGAAAMLCFIRDLVTAADCEMGRPEFLVMLETISRDHQLFPNGMGHVMWNCEDDVDDQG